MTLVVPILWAKRRDGKEELRDATIAKRPIDQTRGRPRTAGMGFLQDEQQRKCEVDSHTGSCYFLFMMARSSLPRITTAVTAGVLMTGGLAGCTLQSTPQPTTTVTETVTATPTPSPSPTVTPLASPPVLATVNAFGDSTGVIGFGTIAPTHIYQGGDPTGDVTNITWVNWGDANAFGVGTACYVDPGQDVAHCRPLQAIVLASNLGTCDGRPAYENVGWWFPSIAGNATHDEGNDIRDCLYPPGG